MLKIHTADGQTHPVDLADADQARLWLARLDREEFQATIQGVSLVERHSVGGKCLACGEPSGRKMSVQYAVSRPDGARRVFVHAEHVEAEGRVKGGERVTLFVDDMRLVMMAHASQPAARITLAHVGKQTFNALKARAR